MWLVQLQQASWLCDSDRGLITGLHYTDIVVAVFLYHWVTRYHIHSVHKYSSHSRATLIIDSTSTDLASFGGAFAVHSRGTSGDILLSWWYPGTFLVVPAFLVFISYRIPPPSRIEGSGPVAKDQVWDKLPANVKKNPVFFANSALWAELV